MQDPASYPAGGGADDRLTGRWLHIAARAMTELSPATTPIRDDLTCGAPANPARDPNTRPRSGCGSPAIPARRRPTGRRRSPHPGTFRTRMRAARSGRLDGRSTPAGSRADSAARRSRRNTGAWPSAPGWRTPLYRRLATEAIETPRLGSEASSLARRPAVPSGPRPDSSSPRPPRRPTPAARRPPLAWSCAVCPSARYRQERERHGWRLGTIRRERDLDPVWAAHARVHDEGVPKGHGLTGLDGRRTDGRCGRSTALQHPHLRCAG